MPTTCIQCWITCKSQQAIVEPYPGFCVSSSKRYLMSISNLHCWKLLIICYGHELNYMYSVFMHQGLKYHPILISMADIVKNRDEIAYIYGVWQFWYLTPKDDKISVYTLLRSFTWMIKNLNSDEQGPLDLTWLAWLRIIFNDAWELIVKDQAHLWSVNYSKHASLSWSTKLKLSNNHWCYTNLVTYQHKECSEHQLLI